MTSIDSLFKKPIFPSGSTKRKFEAPDAQQAYKSTKLSANGSPNGTNGTSASVEDEDDDVEAGPSLPPEEDVPDDDEGRFFGGGVTKDTAKALDYVDGQDEDVVEEVTYDVPWLRRLALDFEKKINKNAELRAKYEHDAQKFITSEADLDADIKSLSILAEHPDLYPEVARIGTARSLVELLAHENTDIAIGALEIVAELIDEDVPAEPAQWEVLVEAMLEADLMGLLMSNLDRLDESEESDKGGVYHSLAVLEALASQQAVAEKVGTEKVLEWLCQRMKRRETLATPKEQNTQYAAEVLQVLLQISQLLRRRLANDLNGVDLFLQLLAAYRKRDPVKDSNEEEWAENVFDGLTCVLGEPVGKAKFVEAEGVELALIMLKEGSFSKSRALRLLDHAVGGQDGAEAVCERLVEAAGLKTVFSLFGKKNADAQTVEHLLGIFAALLRHLPGESATRIRTLAKFAEKHQEKVSKLTGLRKEYAAKVATVDRGIRDEQAELRPEALAERADEWFSRRLDGGLYCLQIVDVILAWLWAEDAHARELVKKHISAEVLKESLQEQLESLEGATEEDGETREMLGTLVECLR